MCLIDKKVAMNYLMGNEVIFTKIKDSFLDSYHNFQDDQASFNASKNVKQAHFYIHSLKGISLNLGALKLYDDSNLVLEELKKGLWNQDLVDRFFQTLDKTYQELKEL